MVHYTYLGQCCFLLEFDGTRIVTDPHFSELRDCPRNYPAPCTLAELAPDAVIISHSHIDHLDPLTLAPYIQAGGQATIHAPAPECGHPGTAGRAPYWPCPGRAALHRGQCHHHAHPLRPHGAASGRAG